MDFSAFVIVWLFCAATDLLSALMRYCADSPFIDFKIRDYIKLVNQYPWQTIAFGLLLGAGCSIALRRRQKIGANESFAIALIFPMVQFILSWFAGALGSILSGSPMTGPIIMAVLALFFGILAQGILFIDLGPLGLVLLALAGGGVTAFGSAPWMPFNPMMCWYTVIGLVLALFVSRQAVA